jgi:hypothetical protein
LFNHKKEYLEEISLLIGGLQIQHPHCDFQRAYAQVKFGNNKLHVIHEIGRKAYNEAMDSPFAPSSIIFNMSCNNNGCKITILASYCRKTDDPNYISIKFGGNHVYKVISRTEKKSYDGSNKLKLITIEVPHGIQFVGDFMHAGANITKYLKTEPLDSWHNFVKFIACLCSANLINNLHYMVFKKSRT